MRNLLSILALAVLALACAKRSPDYAYAPEASYDEYSGDSDYRAEYAPAAPPPPPAPASAAPATRTTSSSYADKKKGGPSRAGATSGAAPEDPYGGQRAPEEPVERAPSEAPGEAPAARMVHYSGWARIEATKTDALLSDVSKAAEDIGGFVEQLTATSVTVRVPVSRFEEAFRSMLALGEVVEKNITAEDVTDAFAAVDLRLRTAKSTRDRLVTLLAQARTESEKLQILSQIRRLSEQIDVMEGQLRTLASLANFSRITIEAVPREAFASRAPGQDPVGFSWIHTLSPFRRGVAADWKLSELAVPTGFVALDVKKRFIAESADGAVIWTARLDNDPQGDAAFWIASVRQRLSDDFKSVEEQSIGGYKVLRFVSETDDDYRYLVGVRVDGDALLLVQVYYPSEETEQRYADAVRAVIAGGKS